MRRTEVADRALGPSALQNAELHDALHEFGRCARSELPLRVRAVHLHGALRNVEFGRDLLVEQAPRHRDRDFALTLRELFEGARFAHPFDRIPARFDGRSDGCDEDVLVDGLREKVDGAALY